MSVRFGARRLAILAVGAILVTSCGGLRRRTLARTDGGRDRDDRRADGEPDTVRDAGRSWEPGRVRRADTDPAADPATAGRR